MTTFPDLMTRLLAGDASRPLVTYYDEATGERVELSVVTYANWVAKTASLLVDELDLERGDRLLVDLPIHWLGPVFLGAAWTAGLSVCLPGEESEPDAVICGPDGLARWGGAAESIPVIATALLPLGVRFAESLPAGVHDFGVEVWGQPDAFVHGDPPAPDDPARPDLSQRALLETATAADLVGDGDRLLTDRNPASPSGLLSFLAPLARGGSAVWVSGADAARRAALAATERVDVVLDAQP